ncbi:hypothetical protein ACHAWC_007454 [Mediolabrus comicus]
MTFIDPTQKLPSPGLVAGYIILTLVSLACAAWAVQLGCQRTHYRHFFSVRVLFPIAILILALENACLAASGKFIEQSQEGDTMVEAHPLVRAIFVLQPFEVPFLLIVTFEVTYLIHKRRSVNFCGMYFDEGRRLNNTQAMSLLLVMNLMVNFDFIQSGVLVDQLAGRAGWWSLFSEEGTFNQKLHLFLSLLPTAVLVAVSFYLSIMLWRYGTSSSMIVHSSICNPWFYSFFGTLFMAAGQLFSEKLYPIMSNTGLLIYIITVEAVMVEVDKDIVAIENEASFLVCVALKGDQISVVRPTNGAVEPQQQNEETPAVTDNADVASTNNVTEPSDEFRDEETPPTAGEEDNATKEAAALAPTSNVVEESINSQTESTTESRKEK